MSARRRIIPIFVPHSGCPNDCVFCNQRRISGSAKAATPETVKRGIEAALPASGEGCELAFYGGSFTAIPIHEQEALLDAALPFLRSGALSSIRVSTRPDAVDIAVLERLKRYGVKTVELGAQSMVERVLLASNRGHSAEDTACAAKLIKSEGLKLILQMMTGLPGSDFEQDVETARRIVALKPDGARIYPTVVVRDTELYDMWKSGAYAEHTVEDAVRVCAKILPMFEAAEIPVIRLGLNPTEELSGGGAVAGAYHPALGELVRARIMLTKARLLLQGTEPGSDVLLGVNPSRVSAMIGQKRENLRLLTDEFALKSLKVASAKVEADKIVLLSIAKEREM